MKKYLPLLGAILLLLLAYSSGFSKAIGLAWFSKATLIGGLVGSILVLFIIWLKFSKPVFSKLLETFLVTDFFITVGITYYFARIFIDSADFEPTAGFVWYIGYHIGVALFIVTAASVLQKILPLFVKSE